MKKVYKFIFIIISSFILFACENNPQAENQNDNNQNDNNQKIEVKNISANRLIDQTPSNEAKEILKNHNEVTGIKAANTATNLIIAVEIEHSRRLQLKEIKKELTEEVKKHFKNLHVELTVDKKIFLELDKLEKQIEANTIKPTKLGKEIDRITKLSKEKT
ncbi:hypothetical protein [Oceanobacillus sp. Castelsardo]|uniref:hypothetical protein n=1 Tax=Oceanobacillus sp. Castelsardo TaxID=1851204 RepID=UPI0008383754|nr:hypothetical protein [Oceanobacillus sp. Castelsardo]